MVFLFYAYHLSYFLVREGEMIMLSIKHLTKIYSGNKKAVDDISFRYSVWGIYRIYWNQWKWKTTALRMINPYGLKRQKDKLKLMVKTFEYESCRIT